MIKGTPIKRRGRAHRHTRQLYQQ